MRKIITFATIVVALAAVTAPAATFDLTAYGWQASWDSSLDSYVTLAVDQNGSDPNSVFIEKSVNFTSAFVNPAGFVEPVVIVFKQVSADAKRLVIINDETLANNTGFAWDGFRMTLMQGSTGTEADTHFQAAEPKSGTGNPGGFDIDPFTQYAFSNHDTVLDVSGGIVNNGDVWTPGQGLGKGELTIVALPVNGGVTDRVFVLKEQPSIIAIPLPAAAWTGLSGLVALGAFSATKKLRSLMA